MIKVILGLGSNTKYEEMQPVELLAAGCISLSELLCGMQISSVYESKAMYVTDQENFYNMAVKGFVPEGTDPFEFLNKINIIEAKYGRDREKEIRFGPQTDDHDYNFKLKHAREFINDGNKVKAFVFFKGRSIVFKEQGEVLLLRFANDLEEIAKVESLPVLEGKRMSVILAPKKPGQPKKAQKPAEQQTKPVKEVAPEKDATESTEE